MWSRAKELRGKTRGVEGGMLQVQRRGTQVQGVSVMGKEGKGGMSSQAAKSALTEGAGVPYKGKDTGREEKLRSLAHVL